MTTQTVFKRHEIKYVITKQQYKELAKIMKDHMSIDQFGKHTINNVYFDTSDFLLIRRSIEKPMYKEKLRVRSYGKNSSKVFVEVKKKFDGIVYKRRLELDRKQAFDFLLNDVDLEQPTQISKEIQYFMKYYKNLQPMISLNYQREAYYCTNDDDFRITFDTNIIIEDINSKRKARVVPDDTVLLEIKTSIGIPRWLLDFFSANAIYKTSFSKYGKAYEKFILPECKGEITNVA